MNRRLLLAAVLFFLLTLPALCADSPRVWVVAIGVSKYIQPLNALPKAADGAQGFVEALAAGRPGATDVTLLTTDAEDESEQPMKANIVRSLTQLSQNVKPSDLAIFYFCGHGIELNRQQYLLTKEADLSSSDGIAASTVSLSWVRKKMEALPCSGRLVILDACRETPASLKRTGGVGAPSPMTKDFLTSGGGWQAQPGKVSATLFGCDQGEQVHYGKNGSFFTEALVDGLSGGAVDKTGQVTLGSLAEYVRKRVPEAVHREFGKDAEQMPVLRGTGKSIVLRPSAGYIACFALAGEYGDVFAEMMQTRLAESGKVRLVERSSLASAMKELKFQYTGLTEAETAQKLGKMVNAKYVLAGSSKKGPDGKLLVTARLVAVASGQNIPGVAATANVDPANWTPAISAMADDLLSRMEGTVLTGTAKAPAFTGSGPSTVPAAGPVMVNPADGAEMVLVPAGEFLMGSSDADPDAKADEKPQHKVYLDSYYVYRKLVTVAQYRGFCQATGRSLPSSPSWGWIGDHPMVNVSWEDATAYAQWAGCSLPTEAQWEKAARGTDERAYPWGNTWDVSKCLNSVGTNKPDKTAPVGSFPAGESPYGVLDMEGNTGQWCADWYSADYYSASSYKNPTGPATGETHVMRGTCWLGTTPESFRVAARASFGTPTGWYGWFGGYGFRCVFTNIASSAASVPAAPISGGSITPAAALGKVSANPRDGAEMITIPAGEFIMGTSDEQIAMLPAWPREWFNDEQPQHRVNLNSYKIYKYEVTVAQYRRFCSATGRAMPAAPPHGWQDDNPMCMVTWDDAVFYAKWAGGRLPTEAEWEKAYRGTDGRIYEWGDRWLENMSAASPAGSERPGTAAVGSYPTDISPYGCMDMAANVHEWCNDFYAPDYYKSSPTSNPKGPSTGKLYVARGGNFVVGYSDGNPARCAKRYGWEPNTRSRGLGFRVAMD